MAEHWGPAYLGKKAFLNTVWSEKLLMFYVNEAQLVSIIWIARLWDIG